MKYGPKAPKHAEIIWVKANEVDKIISKGLLKDKGLSSKNMSGAVIHSNWPFSEALSLSGFLKSKYYKEKQWLNNFNPKHTKRIKREISLAFCIDHWVNGVSWQDTGAYDLVENFLNFMEDL